MGIFVGVVVLTQTGVKQLEEQAQITVFFKDDFSQDKILNLKEGLEKDARILQVTYVSKDNAYKIFSEINRNDPTLREAISADILPASLEVKAKKIANLDVLATEFGKIDGVEEVKFFKDVVDRFRFFSSVSYIVGAALIAIFLVISYAITSATLRTIINFKGAELEILKLVGASELYVKKPLVFQGIVFGLVGGSSAAVVLCTLYISVFFNLLKFNELTLVGFLPFKVNVFVFTAIFGVVIVLFGTLFGYLGSARAIKKYLVF